MDLEGVMVIDLIQELEPAIPDAEARIARQPRAVRGRRRPGTAAVQLDLGGTSVVDLGQGAQLGDLPGPVRAQPGW